jgi:excisionase family DNA binding protein
MFLTVEEAAFKLHCNVDTVRRLAAADKIPARKVGRRWLFHPDLLDKYMRNEWQSTSEVPADPGTSSSHLAERLFAAAAVRQIGSSPRNTKPRSGRATSGKRN